MAPQRCWRLALQLLACAALLHGSLALEDLEARYYTPIVHGKYYTATVANASLLPWEDVVAGLPDCKPGAWAEMAHGRWAIDRHGEVFYEPSTCRLRRLTGDQARSCLANKTVAFVGCSLTRYQYVTFAHFIAHGRYMQRYADDGQANLVIEKMWGNYTKYFEEGAKLMEHADASGSASEHCHCFRRTIPGSHEHRLLTLNVTRLGGAPAQATVRVLYNQTFGILQGVANDTRDAVAWNLAQQPPSDYVAVNVGHWLNHGMADGLRSYTDVSAAYEPLFATADALLGARAPRPQLLWKTTTVAREPAGSFAWNMKNWNPVWHRLLNSQAMFHRWPVYDVHAITRQMIRDKVDGYWDNLHFLPFVYEQMNDVLLNAICPISPSASAAAPS